MDTMQRTQKPPAEVEQTPADTMRGAALYLKRHGWTQRRYYLTDAGAFPPACVFGALGMAAYGHITDSPFDNLRSPAGRAFDRAQQALDDYLARTIATEPAYIHISDWNDELCFSTPEVIAALQAAAEDWERQHPGGVR